MSDDETGSDRGAGRPSSPPTTPTDRWREWELQNPDRAAAAKRTYRETHRDDERERERERRARARAEQARAEARRAYAREYYAKNRESYLERQRVNRAVKKAQDPGAYRAAKNARQRRWYARHQEVENEKVRDAYRDDPTPRMRWNASYRANHADELAARRREFYLDNRERMVERDRRRREREKLRRSVGLPPRRLHRVSTAERRQNRSEADEFFRRKYTAAEIRAAKRPWPTPPELIAAWQRESERARAAFSAATGSDIVRPISKTAQRAAERASVRAAALEQLLAEEARLDAIARAINDQLRHRLRRPQQPEDAGTTGRSWPAAETGVTR
ncbi:hypothetical protein GCM10009777_10490 [Microbacterium pumilum]|uniref:Uncharacterized protein n=1 Tax=Microbacterium pumilum TaxID=344165 RepID=A0ABN2S269_9MICO